MLFSIVKQFSTIGKTSDHALYNSFLKFYLVSAFSWAMWTSTRSVLSVCSEIITSPKTLSTRSRKNQSLKNLDSSFPVALSRQWTKELYKTVFMVNFHYFFTEVFSTYLQKSSFLTFKIIYVLYFKGFCGLLKFESNAKSWMSYSCHQKFLWFSNECCSNCMRGKRATFLLVSWSFTPYCFFKPSFSERYDFYTLLA